jgi:hypothetical protein
MSRTREMLLHRMLRDGLAVVLVLACVSILTAAQAHTVVLSTCAEMLPHDNDAQELAQSSNELPHHWQEGDGRTLVELDDPESLTELDASESQSDDDDENGVLDASTASQRPSEVVSLLPAPVYQRGVDLFYALEVLLSSRPPRGPPQAIG